MMQRPLRVSNLNPKNLQKTCNPQFDMVRKPGEIHRESAMSDFTLSITKHPSGLTVTATGGKKVTLELPGLSGLVGAEAGRRLYQQVFSGPVLLPTEREQAPARGVEVEDGPLRVLLTLMPDEEHAALGAAIDQWIDRLEQRDAGRVVVRKVKVTGGYQGLLKVFRQALTPFHLWQHVGPCGPGLALRLGNEVVQVRDINTLLAQQKAACCV